MAGTKVQYHNPEITIHSYVQKRNVAGTKVQDHDPETTLHSLRWVVAGPLVEWEPGPRVTCSKLLEVLYINITRLV